MTPSVYFAHPEELRRPGLGVAKQIEAAGFDVYNPLETALSEEWRRRPGSELARKIWRNDFGMLVKSDALFAWLPRNAFTGIWREGSHPPIGTQMEIIVALQINPIRVYIVTDIFHPFLVATGRCFPTVEKAIEEMRADFGGRSELAGKMQAQVVNVTNAANRRAERDIYSWKFPKMAVKRGLNTPPGEGGAKERGIKEAIAETWRLIDISKERLADPKLRENDKIRWAGVLASTIGALNKLLWKAGAGQVEEEDLAQILSKMPEKYAKMVKKRLAKDELPQTHPPQTASFKGVERGDVVQVEWLDASLCRNVVNITNRAIATYKTTIGKFAGIFRDARHHAPHAIIIHEIDEDGKYEMSSIPVFIVMRVTKLSPKTPLKKFKRGTDSQWTQSLPGGGVKISTRRPRR